MLDIYSKEIEDGLESLMLSSSSIAYACDIRQTPQEFKEGILSSLQNEATANNLALAFEQSQPDLYYMSSVLATLGWNLNDDIFLRCEVIPAKNTPIDKPFNKMHNQDDIIGHMTSSLFLDSDWKPAPDETFEHIAVNSVIYKAWRDKDKKAEILQTIAEIDEGKWKVSMECLFSKFDYGIITADGKQLIVERTPETSYLTKHLRAYGGTGTYQGNKVGRVLRNITFCGKGLVDNPGNPHSIIFNNNKKFFGATASLNEFKENKMTEAEKAEFEKAKADLASAQAALAEFKVTTAKEVENKLNSAIAERDTKIATLQSDITSTVAKLAEANEKVTVSESAKAELAVNLEKAVAELNTIRAEQTLASRKAALAAVVAPERVEALLAKVGGLPEAAFASVVESLAEFVPFKKGDKEDAKDAKDKDEKKEGETKADFTQASLDTDTINSTDTALASQKRNADDTKTIISFLTSNMTKQKAKAKGDK